MFIYITYKIFHISTSKVILSLDDTLRRCLQHSYYTSNQLLESPLAANLQSPTESPILTPSECCSKGITVEQRGDDDGGVERYVAVDPKYLEPFCGLDELDFKDTNVTSMLLVYGVNLVKTTRS